MMNDTPMSAAMCDVGCSGAINPAHPGVMTPAESGYVGGSVRCGPNCGCDCSAMQYETNT